MNIIYKLFFLVFLLIGFYLRLANLAVSPPSLNWDEAALGYNAYSVSITGRDEYGKLLPIFTRSFDEYKSALPLYLMIPSIKIFGLNEVGVRLPSALLGCLTIIIVFLITKRLYEDPRASYFAASLFAIEPWSVHLARVYQEATTALFLFLLGILLLIVSENKKRLLIFSLVLFLLSMYTYNANKVLVPMFLLSYCLLEIEKINKIAAVFKKELFLIFLVLVGPFLYLTLKGEAFARVSSTNIFSFFPITPSLADLIREHNLSQFLSFFLHNPLYYFLWEVVGRYFAYFSPLNLFIREPQEPVTILAGNSIFHAFEFIPWLIGLLWLVRNHTKQKIVTLCILLSPIPAILTWNWFQPGRVMALFSFFSILIGVGLTEIIRYLGSGNSKNTRKKLLEFSFIYFFLVFFAVSSFYVYDSINVYSAFRDYGNYQPGFKETVPEVMSLYDKYDNIIIETPQAQPYIFYLFYGKFSPTVYLSELDLNKIGTPRKYYDFNKFHFRKIHWPEDKHLARTLFVGNENNLPKRDLEEVKNVNVIKDIKNSYGDSVAKIVGLGTSN